MNTRAPFDSLSTVTPLTLPGTIALAARDKMFYLILITFLALATAWNFVTPIFEAPDEAQHLQYIVFVANEGRRPNLLTDVAQAGTASFESPLYYLVVGTILRISGIAHPFTLPTRNPRFSFNFAEGDKNYYLRSAERYDYVHFLRSISTLFGLVTVTCTYLVAGLLGANRTLRLSAMAFTAFLPQFTFISGALNNDNLAAAVASIGFVLLIHMLNASAPRLIEALIFGAICGVGLLTKPHTLYLVPFAALMFLVTRRSDWKRLFMLSITVMFGFVLTAGWYLTDNFLRYGDPLAIRMAAGMLPELVDPKSLSDPVILFQLPVLLFLSFLGVFGWMKIILPLVFYSTFATLCLFSLFGAVRGIRSGAWTPLRSLLFVPPLIILALLIYYNLTFNSNQGRFFFPVLAAIASLFVFGLMELPRRFANVTLVTVPVFFFATNLYSLWLVSGIFASV